MIESINEAPSRVIERLNSLLDKKNNKNNLMLKYLKILKNQELKLSSQLLEKNNHLFFNFSIH